MKVKDKMDMAGTILEMLEKAEDEEVVQICGIVIGYRKIDRVKSQIIPDIPDFLNTKSKKPH